MNVQLIIKYLHVVRYDITFWRFLAASCRGEETVCVKKSDVNENFYSVHTNYTVEVA